MPTRRAWRRSLSWLASLIALLACFADGSTLAAAQAGQSADVRAWLSGGHYDDAEAAAQSLVASAGRGTSSTTPEAVDASNLWVEALWRNGRSTTSTRTAAEAALQLARTLDGGRSPLLSTSLRNLGQVAFLSGRYQESASAFEKGVSVEDALGRNGPELADLLDDLATALIAVNRYDDAQKSLDRALPIARASRDVDETRLARTFELQSQVFQRLGRYADAAPPIQQALAIRERLQPGHPDLAHSISLAGDLAVFDGHYQEARTLYARSLDIAEATLRPEHPDIALYATRLANMLVNLGDYQGAFALRTRAVSVARQSLGNEHPALAGYLNDLALSHLLNEDYAKARPLLENALSMQERTVGASHQSVATTVFNLAIVSRWLGDTRESRRLYMRAIEIWRRWLGPNHPLVANALGRLAQVALDEGKFAEALKMTADVLAVREHALGENHTDVARTLVDMAAIQTRLHRSAEAEVLSQRAVRIWEAANAPRSTAFAAALDGHARILASLGRYSESREFLARALTIYEDVYGPSHPDATSARSSLAAVLLASGQVPASFQMALDAERRSRGQLRLTLRYLPEREAIGYAGRRIHAMDAALSAIDRLDDRESPRLAYDQLIRSRALVLDEMAARQRVSTDRTRPDLAPLWTAVVSARQRFANLAVRGGDERRPGDYLALLDGARRERDLAERALADRNAAFKAEVANDEIGLDDIAGALPDDSVLVSFTRFEQPGTEGQTTPHYAAFVLRSGQRSPAAVMLGPAATIDAAIAAWRREAAMGAVNTTRQGRAPEQTYRVAGERLRRLVWDQLAEHVSGALRVFIVPDGTVNLVNFAALPAGEGEYLLERGPVVHYLSAERDLVPSPRTQPTGSGLLALGGAAFNAAGGTAAAASQATFRGSSSHCPALRSLRFTALPGTTREASEVASLWGNAEAAQLLDGDRASEAAFKQMAPGRRVLHVATHGFFLGADCPDAPANSRAVGGLVSGPSDNQRLQNENPLLLAGLALAGANRRSTSRESEDGILTAEEVGALDLSGVEWAVLSACDTGLGEIKAGEGVLGLRRAFQVAGVKTVIMSLWSVEDQATRLWMRALYEGRLQRHLSTADAVREASLTVLRDRRARGLSTHPFYWAAFVAAGDWR